MKKFIITGCLFLFAMYVRAQGKNIETEIRSLEQTEVQAILMKDTVTLEKLWDKHYVVNNPDNKIVLATPNPFDRPVLRQTRISFTREVEKIIINTGIVVSMGSESIVPTGDNPKSGQTVKRRYTHIWVKKKGSWKLTARHANVVCQPN